jgi:ABC-type uncharacterized transport system fused permease/ATPase subunit
VVGLLMAAMTLVTYLRQALEIRWRRHLTDTMMQRWLQDDTFYRIERDCSCDNPDLRLSQGHRRIRQADAQPFPRFRDQSGRAGDDGLDPLA